MAGRNLFSLLTLKSTHIDKRYTFRQRQRATRSGFFHETHACFLMVDIDDCERDVERINMYQFDPLLRQYSSSVWDLPTKLYDPWPGDHRHTAIALRSAPRRQDVTAHRDRRGDEFRHGML